MNLSEYLKGTKASTVSIGTKGGSGYLYIGAVNNLPGIANSFGLVYRAAKREMADDKRLLVSGRVQDENYAARVQHRIDIRSKYISNYLPVLKREVLSTFDRITEDGVAVIVDGTEYGYWSKKELEAKIKFTRARYML